MINQGGIQGYVRWFRLYGISSFYDQSCGNGFAVFADE